MGEPGVRAKFDERAPANVVTLTRVRFGAIVKKLEREATKPKMNNRVNTAQHGKIKKRDTHVLLAC